MWSVARVGRKRLAGHIRMPVHECAVRILLPRPHMQRVERRKPEPVRSLEIVEELSHQLWWSAVVRFVPGVSQHQEVRSGQPRLPVCGRLVDHDLRTGGIEDAGTY